MPRWATRCDPPQVITADEPAFSRRTLPASRRALEQLDRPVTLVLDDLHVLPWTKANPILEAVPASLPEGSRIALVGRTEPGLPTTAGRGRDSSHGWDRTGWRSTWPRRAS